MNNENNNTNEDKITTEEVIEMVTTYVELGQNLYKKTKIGLVRRGFILGLITAVALQSLATIVALVWFMN